MTARNDYLVILPIVPPDDPAGKESSIMANTYTQIYVQVVFAVRNRRALISPQWKERLHRYITGIVQNHGHKLIAINAMPDHIHIFIGLKPHDSLSDLIRDVKRSSTVFVNDTIRPPAKFSWQQGFGAFTYSRSQIDMVVKYIQHQEKHHRQRSFHDEYIEFLDEFSVSYDPKYLFSRIIDER